jgi:hypothetical protein
VRHLTQRRGRLAIAAALGTLLVATVAAPSSAAGTWGQTKSVLNQNKSTVSDAELRARFVVVGVAVPTDGTGSRLRLVRSNNAGNSFRDPNNVRNGTRQASVTVCGDGTPVAVYGRHTNASGWTIEQSIRTGGDNWNRRTLTTGSEAPRHPESTCESDPSVVWSAWLTKIAGNYSVKVVRASTSDAGAPPSINLGPTGTTQTGPVITALSGGTGVAVAWRGQGGNVVTRNVLWNGSALSMSALVILGQGTGNQPAKNPQAGSFNQRIVVTWTQCNDVFARVSTNNASTWANARRLANQACPGNKVGTPTSAAVRQNNVLVGYDLTKPSNSRERIVTSSNNFTNFKNTNTTSQKDAWLPGYVVVSGDTRLGVVFEQGPNIRFRRCSQTVCPAF